MTQCNYPGCLNRVSRSPRYCGPHQDEQQRRASELIRGESAFSGLLLRDYYIPAVEQLDAVRRRLGEIS